MGQFQDFPLPDGSYADDTRPWSQQDIINYIPTFAEASGTRSRIKYRVVPGLQTFANVGTGPHRASRDVEGKLFVVSGTTLYQVAPDGTATSKGTIPGTGFVSMTHNQIDGGNQLVIGTRDNSYVYNTVTGALAATGVGLLSVDFLNQRILGVDTQRRFWRYSGLADATSWNDLDNESAESSPDRIVGGIVSQGEWLVFGERTIEVWANSPTENTAFQRSTVIERGCLNANTIRRLDNTVFFVDNNAIPCRLNGYQPMPIAPKSIVAELRACDPSKLFAFTWEDGGYVVYYITAQDGRTWGFDVTSGKWHRRESFGLDRWRLNTLTKWNGEWYGGDYSSGKLYRLRWKYVYEGCEIMPRHIRSGVMHGNGNRVFLHGFKLALQTGGEDSSVDAGSAPSISGDLPTASFGDSVHFQYTITPGYPGQIVTLTLDGALPTGLTLDAAGLVSGTITAAGTFNWTITPASECAIGQPLADSAVVNVHLVSAGEGSRIYKSLDSGATWTHLTTGLTEPDGSIHGIAQGATNIVFVGNTGAGTARVIYSPNLTAFTAVSPAITVSVFAGVAGSGTSLVAVGNTGGTADGKITRSTDDGATWTAITAPAGCGPLSAVAYADSRYVGCSMSGKIIVSTDDGQTWAKYNVGTYFLDVAYGNGTWIAVGNSGETRTATDPAGTWTFRSSPGGPNYSFLTVSPGPAAGVFYAGSNGVSTYAGIYRTTDYGATWTRVQATNNNVNGTAEVSGLFVATDQGSSLWASATTTTWASTPIVTGVGINDIAVVRV